MFTTSDCNTKRDHCQCDQVGAESLWHDVPNLGHRHKVLLRPRELLPDAGHCHNNGATVLPADGLYD